MGSLIDDLQEPAALPDPTTRVSLVQTHISLVFVADLFVYKVKKPVDFGFLDFSTLEKRKHYCAEEVRLNQRLSKGVYLGVVPVTLEEGRHRLGGDGGPPVEFAVRMRRIPDDRLMRTLYEKGGLRDDHLDSVAALLAGFHCEAERSERIDEFGKLESFKVNTDENFAQTEAFIGTTVQRDDFDRIRDWTRQFYQEEGGLFDKRIQKGRVRDCHGDLHMEHICFLDPVAAIDCIEFNERFRYSDTLADIAFLLMDLEFRGGAEIAGRLWAKYSERADESGMERLLAFYKVYRAYVRGKVISFQLNDPQIQARAKQEAAETAGAYFRLARHYVETAP
ncbi:MAG: phosphotransferase [Thermodesulfobacteriota bacterium]